jgi:hypothetical protein
MCWRVGEGQWGGEHVKLAQTGVFYVYEEEGMGQWGGEHIKHARQACFMCWRGGVGVEQVPNTKTRPSGRVFVFDGSGEVPGGWWWC